MEICQRVESIVRDTLGVCVARGEFELSEIPSQIPVQKPHAPHDGDFASTICLELASTVGVNARELARLMLMHLDDPQGILDCAEMAGPGFLNFRVRPAIWLDAIREIPNVGRSYGRSPLGQGRKVLVECRPFRGIEVMGIQEGREAIITDVIASMLEAVGYDVEREYYIQQAVPEDLRTIRQGELDRLGVQVDSCLGVTELEAKGRVHEIINHLRLNGYLRHDGLHGTWFESSKFGDSEDRLVVNSDGQPTVFAANVAYQFDKIQRGYDLLIHVRSADQNESRQPVEYALRAIHAETPVCEVLSVAPVNWLEPDARALRTVGSLPALVGSVGAESTRCHLISAPHDHGIALELAGLRSQSLENPVHFVQFGYSRLRTLLTDAKRKGHQIPAGARVNLSTLTLPEELDLIRHSHDYPGVLRQAALARTPHLLIDYLQQLMVSFERYLDRTQRNESLISNDVRKTSARLFLCECLRTIVGNALQLLGVSEPDQMCIKE